MMTLDRLAAGIELNGYSGITMFSLGNGWMVSLKTGLGFRVFYGTELEETVTRAMKNGPQRPVDDDYDPEAEALL